MPSLFKSAVLGFGLLAGVGAAAHAQSVSALPPTSPATGQIVTPPPSSTTQSFFPKPGGNQAWEEQHYQPNARYDADAAQHPYSTSVGPKPGAHSSGQDVHYQATDEDAAPSRHPYTAHPVLAPSPAADVHPSRFVTENVARQPNWGSLFVCERGVLLQVLDGNNRPGAEWTRSFRGRS